MPWFKKNFLMRFVLVLIFIAGGYWFLFQKYQIEPFAKQINSIKVNPNIPIGTKDYILMKRELITSQNTLNASVFQVVSSLLLVFTAYTAWGNFVVSEKKQIVESFAKAVEQLGSDELHARVGAIFVLEQIAQTSPEYHWIVIEVLTSYIRDVSLKGNSIFNPVKLQDKIKKRDSDNNEEKHFTETGSREVTESIDEEIQKSFEKLVISVTIDVQSALTVIGRRNSKYDPQDRVIDLRRCDITGANIKNANLRYANLIGATISYAHLENANLSGAKLQCADLIGAHLNGANLNKSNLRDAVLKDAYLQKSDLQQSDLMNANFQRADLKGAKLNHANLMNANLQTSELQGAELNHANLTNANFHIANLQGARLNHAILFETKLEQADLQGADLREAKLILTDLRTIKRDNYTKIDKKWEQIYKINVNGEKNKKLDRTDFSDAKLTFANFEDCSLKEANFSGANLEGANFKNADLEGAIFRKQNVGPKLKDANFGDASLKGAVFQNADLQDTNFKGLTRNTDMREVVFEEVVYLANANFENVLLQKARFIKSILTDTKFCKANLKEAVFENCSYDGTSFQEADLNNATFRGNTTGADFSNSNKEKATFQNVDI
jgi:uncharacterized protein YjbI with pentapeptide repeats